MSWWPSERRRSRREVLQGLVAPRPVQKPQAQPPPCRSTDASWSHTLSLEVGDFTSVYAAVPLLLVVMITLLTIRFRSFNRFFLIFSVVPMGLRSLRRYSSPQPLD